MTTTRVFCLSGTVNNAFSYFSRDYYFSTCIFSFTSNSTGGICVLQKIEADNHWLTGFQRSAPTLQLGLWPLLGFFLLRTIKIVLSYFSHDYYFSTCTFSFTSNSTGGNFLFSSLQKIEADSHWLTRLPTQCTNCSAGLWPLLGFFCQGAIKIAFSYFSRDYYFSTCTFSFRSNSTGGICVLQKI